MFKDELVNQIIQRGKLREFIRFGIVGVLATIVHYMCYIVLNLWINTTIAYSIGYVISFLGNFYLSNRFTFRTNPSLKKGIGFGLSHLINYLLQIILLQLFIYIGINRQIAPLPVYIIVIPINFILVRFILKR